MKKIVIASGIFYPDIGGPASYARNIAFHLAKEHKVTVITYSSVFRTGSDKYLGFKVIRVKRFAPGFISHFNFFLKLFFSLKDADAVLTLNAVSAGLPALLAAKIRKKKMIVKIVGDYAWESAVNSGKTSLLIGDFQDVKKKGWIGLLDKLQKKVCKNAELVIVPSQFLADMVAGWGMDKNKIKVIYNGVEIRRTDLSREEARKKIGIPGNLIVSAGRLVSWKGFKMLIKVMPKLLEINQFFRLVILGDGPDRKNLEAIARNMGLDKKVYILGKKTHEEMAVYFAASEMFILNSGYEGHSHQILEAMAFGVPVIASAVGGNKEVIEQGTNGFLVKYNDEFNIVEAIKGLWQLQELREQFNKEGIKTAKKFSCDKMYKETIKAISRT